MSSRSWSRETSQRFARTGGDVLFVVLGVSAAIAEAAGHRHDPAQAWLIATVAGLGGLALWWRRRHAEAVIVLGCAVVAVSGVPIVLFLGLFSMAERRRDRVLVAMAFMAIAALALRWTTETTDGWVRLVGSAAAGVGFAVAAGAYVGARRDLVAALTERAERAEAEQHARAEQARLGEQARIAREMHDVLAHKVSLIAMHAGALEVMRAPTPQQVTTSGGLIRTTANEAMDELRDVLLLLGPRNSSRVPPSRLGDLAQLVDASCVAGADVSLRVELNEQEIPDVLARAAHRIVAEALTNVHRHATGAATVVTVTGSPDGIIIDVTNTRPPAPSAALRPTAGFASAGTGLVGLAERARLLGGTCTAGPDDAGGWRLTTFLPWSAP